MRICRVYAVVVFVATLGVAAICGCGGGDADSPPELVYGEDACRRCIMIINEARYAAGYVDADGVSRGFDDLGCVLELLRGGESVPNVLWVVDHATEEWVRVADAWFVRRQRSG